MIIFGLLSPAEAIPALRVMKSRETIIRRVESAPNFGLFQEQGVIGYFFFLVE
jgi:hypothetical protein